MKIHLESIDMQGVNLSIFKNKKIALVHSGGVVKAASWHLGVGLALEELGFTLKNNNSEQNTLEISSYIGSSAGALINLYYASGFSPSEIIESHINSKEARLRPITYKEMLCFKKAKNKSPQLNIYEPFKEFPLFLKMILVPFLKTNGLFTTQLLKEYLDNYILPSNSFEDFKSDLFVIATQLDHSRKVIFSKYKYPSPLHDSTSVYYKNISVSDSVAASMSVPPFYKPFPVNNPLTNQTDYYIDGEIRETLSTHVAKDNGADFIISSWTHTPYHYHDEIGSLVNYGLPAICTQAIYLMIQKKIVDSRVRHKRAADIVDTVHQYMKSEKFSREQTNKILSILERKLDYRPNIKFIDIYPKHENYEIFFQNSFTLNPKKMSEMVTLGYKRTIEIFKSGKWQNS